MNDETYLNTKLIDLNMDVRRIGILLSVSILTYSSSWAWYFALVYQISSKSVSPRRSYDVISILQDGGHGVTNLLPIASLVTLLA